MEQTKQCKVCQTVKPLSEYGKQKGAKDGHINMCKTCKVEYQRVYNKRKGITGAVKKKIDKEEKAKKVIPATLKDFQINAVKFFGNTIVSKKHKPQAIIAEYKRHGIDVVVLKFESKTAWDNDTHYKVVKC